MQERWSLWRGPVLPKRRKRKGGNQARFTRARPDETTAGKLHAVHMSRKAKIDSKKRETAGESSLAEYDLNTNVAMKKVNKTGDHKSSCLSMISERSPSNLPGSKTVV